jgi:hypothetical protein
VSGDGGVELTLGTCRERGGSLFVSGRQCLEPSKQLSIAKEIV